MRKKTRLSRRKAKILHVKDDNVKDDQVTNSTKKDSHKDETKTDNTDINPAAIRIKNIFNNFNNVKNISETPNPIISIREENVDNKESLVEKCKQVSSSIDKMVMSGKVDFKVLRSLLDHVSGGDIAGILAKLITSSELDKIVNKVGDAGFKQRDSIDDIDTTADQNNDDIIEITNEDNQQSSQHDEISVPESENGLTNISDPITEIFIAEDHQSNDDVKISQVVVDKRREVSKSQSTHGASPSQSTHGASISQSTHGAPPSQSTHGASPSQSTHGASPSQSTHGPSISQSTHGPSISQSTYGSRRTCPTDIYSGNMGVEELIHRLMVTGGGQVEAEMTQFLQQNGFWGGTQSRDVTEMEARMMEYLRHTGYAGYQNFLTRLTLPPEYAHLLTPTPGLSSSTATVRDSMSLSESSRGMLSQSLMARGNDIIPDVTLTQLSTSRNPLLAQHSTPPPAHKTLPFHTYPLPAHRYTEPATITGASRAQVVTNRDDSTRQLYSDPRRDLPQVARIETVPGALRSTVVGTATMRPTVGATTTMRPVLPMPVESLAKSDSVVANSYAKSLERKKQSNTPIKSDVTKADINVKKRDHEDDGDNYHRNPKKRKHKLTNSNDSVVKNIETKRTKLNKRKATRLKGIQSKKFIKNNIIDDSESESLEQSESEEEWESWEPSDSEDNCVYEEAENQNMQKNRRNAKNRK